MSDVTTRGIRVETESSYLPDRSEPVDGDFFFSYKVRISNFGDETVRLVSRSWVVTDADGNVETVEGPGVVGVQPLLAPGESFEYSSFCPLRTAVGTMHGAYRMITVAGDGFDAEIAPFELSVPFAIN